MKHATPVTITVVVRDMQIGLKLASDESQVEVLLDPERVVELSQALHKGMVQLLALNFGNAETSAAVN